MDLPELRKGTQAVNERWWVIAESELLAALRRVAQGHDPDLTMAELLANSSVEGVGDE